MPPCLAPMDPASDPSSPYYVHSSDGPSSVKVTPLLTGSNYHSWSRSMRRALGGKLKLEFVDGTIPVPADQFDPSFRAWNRCNMLVHSWIMNSVSESIAQSIVFMENTIDVWNDLKERFSQADLIRMAELQQDSRSVTEFYSDLKLIWEELEIYLPMPNCSCRNRCTCEAMRSARANHALLYIIRFLTGLNEHFAVVKSQILLMDPLPPMNKVFSLVLQHERQSNFSPSEDSKALLNAAKSKGSFPSKNPARICTFCGKDNHIVANCFKKYGLPPHFRKNSQANNAEIEGGNDEQIAADNSNIITQEQALQLITLLESSFPGQASNSASSNQVGSVDFTGHTSVNQGMHSQPSKSCSLGNWIVDSGASHHMCSSLQWFHSYSEITPIKDQLTKRMIGSANVLEGLYYLDLTSLEVHAYTLDGTQHTNLPYQELSIKPLVLNHMNKTAGLKGNVTASGHHHGDPGAATSRSSPPPSLVEFFAFRGNRTTYPGVQIRVQSIPTTNCARKHQHLLNVGRALLFQAHLPKIIWSYAVQHATYLINRVPSVVLAYASTLQSHRTKLAPRARKCIFLGYKQGVKGTILYDLHSKETFISRNVTHHDHILPYIPSSDHLTWHYHTSSEPIVVTDHFNDTEPIVVPDQPTDIVTPFPSGTDFCEPNSLAHNDQTEEIISPVTDNHILENLSHEIDNHTLDSPQNDNSSENTSLSVLHNTSNDNHIPDPTHKSTRVKHAPSYLSDYVCNQSNTLSAITSSTGSLYPLSNYHSFKNLSSSHHAFTVSITHNTEPTYYLEACKYEYWQRAMNDELDALDKTGTWEIVDLPPNVKPIGSKWIYKVKYKADGSIERYKARLVAKGYNQVEGLDFFDTFSPVAKLTTVRLLLAVASAQEGYTQSTSDYSLFTLQNASHFTALLVYVDDIILVGNDLNEIDRIKGILDTHFKIKDLGILKYFLGLEVAQSRERITISQRKYCLDLLHDSGLLGSKPAPTPLDPAVKLHIDDSKPYEDVPLYRRLIGKLLYLCDTRPDISFATQQLNQFLHKPIVNHYNAASRVIRYLKHNPCRGIFLPRNSDMQLLGFSDSDWAGCLDTRKSTSGYCFFLGSSLISWKAKKQIIVSRSSSEAEYRALSSATCELIWLTFLMNDLKIQCSKLPVIYCDSQSVLHIASNPVFHERTKHLEIDCHLAREKVQQGLLGLLPISTEDQLADCLTKSLAAPKFNELISKLGLIDIFQP
ncbi:hypothetical protein TSUD_130510 [Trifolium subterraneum]|nr:hypothetical protein TSUD_130510 [Trifolium subterraneum]